MTPSQAQIEAAALALHRFEVEHGYISSETALASDETYQTMATAVLAAAAEVGPIDHPNSFAEAQAKIVRLNRELTGLRAATIERCAQVARDKLLSYGHINLAEKVEAAIYALKDKP